MSEETEIMWLIWSHEHCAWWNPNSAGYTYNRADAGQYTFKEACDILRNANFELTKEPHEAMVPLIP